MFFGWEGFCERFLVRCLVRFLVCFWGGWLRRFLGGGFWKGVSGEVFGEVFEKGFL